MTLKREMRFGERQKVQKQKGTGGARAGSLKNPMFKGGGRAFGPHPREYNIKLNKKVKVLARKSALSQMAASNSIVVIEDLTFNTPKTKQFSDVLKGLKLDNKNQFCDSRIQLHGVFVWKKPSKDIYPSS